ncbi:hypothetical protein [Thalassobaculum salexigens]|uniref:hypothetical protein n=1 Tax=Thalassobaculum salexigens TaxID=455360 RepID=UPI0003FA1F9F|nr:hypothetical protein [Thalassobaculum salexigens]
MTDRIVWKFSPVAHAEDPRWLDREIAQTLFVEAPTSGEAIVAATAWDSRNVSGHVGNESAHDHSAFADEKLYRVDRATPQEIDTLETAAGPIWPGHDTKVLNNLTN